MERDYLRTEENLLYFKREEDLIPYQSGCSCSGCDCDPKQAVVVLWAVDSGIQFALKSKPPGLL